MMQKTGSSGSSSSITEAVKAKFGLSQDAIDKIVRVHDHKSPLPVDITQSISVQIINGSGSYTATYTSFWFTVSGTFIIQQPTQGTFNVVVTDQNNDGAIIYQGNGLVPNQQYSFGPYSTGFKVDLQVQVTWSEQQDAQGTVLVNVSV